MVSTATDLERFYTALNSGRLVRPGLLRAMRTTVPSGEGQGYGLGLAAQKMPCGTMWGNGGDFLGYNASAWGTADGRRTLVLFVNLDELSHTPRIQQALSEFLVTAYCGGRR
jgi:D-alanyl-D-alanine carboxypeptidase